MKTRYAPFVLVAALLAPASAVAQGEDGTTAERNILILAELLPGRYDNANQSYFDGRLGRPEEQRHDRLHAELRRIEAPELAATALTAVFHSPGSETEPVAAVYTLEVDYEADAVRMKTYLLDDEPPAGAPGVTDAQYAAGCDVLWREEAGQFHGTPETASCATGPDGEAGAIGADLLLSEDALWVELRGSDRSHYVLERARSFSCYVDVPGVGGGRDIPYKRYAIDDIHDKGGKQWVTLDDGREVFIRLQNVRWPMNNLENIFTRHSFVIYVGALENGEEKEVTYAWTVPTAQRIGMNLKWMLVNCFMLSNEDVTPFFKTEPQI